MNKENTGLGKVSLGKTKQVIDTIAGKERKSLTSEVQKLGSSEVKKFRSLALQKITVPLKDNQVEMLTRICKTIMRKRTTKEKKERITNNSIIRACLDIILPILSSENEILENIKTEEELTGRIKEILKLGSFNVEK